MKLNYRFLLLAMVGIFVFFLSVPEEVGIFKLTHWLFTYEFGFIKRGLIGSIISMLNCQPSYGFLVSCALIVNAALLIVLLAFVSRCLSPKGNISWFLFNLLFICSSATIAHFSYDLGRFDQFGLLILLLSLIILGQKAELKWFIVLLFMIGILIHEAFFFLFFPFITMLAYYVLRSHPNQKLFVTILSSTMLIALTIISLYGHMTLDSKTYADILVSRSGLPLSGNSSVILILYRSLEENIAFSLIKYTKETLFNHIKLLIWQFPVFLLLLSMLHSLYFTAIRLKENNYFILMLAGTLTPFLLYPLGHDFFRWISVVITNIFLLILFLSKDKRYFQNIKDITARYKYLIIIALIISLVIGPIGVTTPFPSPLF